MLYLVCFVVFIKFLKVIAIPFEITTTHGTLRTEDIGPRIYGGQVAEEGKYKYMVYFLLDTPGKGFSFCGSALITPMFILSAAHCMDTPGISPNDMLLIAGRADLEEYMHMRLAIPISDSLSEEKYGVQERRVAAFHIHPRYSNTKYFHDFAVLRTTRAFTLNDNVATIPISRRRMEGSMNCTIHGWGKLPENITTFQLHVLENKEATRNCGFHREFFLCLAKTPGGICKGDSGSPLVCLGQLWGVASYAALPDPNNPICGVTEREYYAEVYPDLIWINEQVGHHNNGISRIYFTYTKLFLYFFFYITQ